MDEQKGEILKKDSKEKPSRDYYVLPKKFEFYEVESSEESFEDLRSSLSKLNDFLERSQETRDQITYLEIFKELKAQGFEPKGFSRSELLEALQELSYAGYSKAVFEIGEKLFSLRTRNSLPDPRKFRHIKIIENDLDLEISETEKIESTFRNVHSRVKRYQQKNETLKNDTRNILAKFAKVVDEL